MGAQMQIKNVPDPLVPLSHIEARAPKFCKFFNQKVPPNCSPNFTYYTQKNVCHLIITVYNCPLSATRLTGDAIVPTVKLLTYNVQII